jgi:FRG domain/SET domain
VRSNLVATTLEEYVKHTSNIRKKWLGENEVVPWFRGHERADWPLIPKFYRNSPTDQNTEDEIREEFQTRAPILSDVKPANKWEWYFLMQHYGAPTRLLDWSDGALIALYFAVRQSRGCHDAAVWILDPWWLNKSSTGVEEVVLPGDPDILPRDKRLVDGWLPKRFERRKGRTMPRRPAAVYPGHIIRRIGAQRSCFTIHGTDPAGLDRLAVESRSHLLKIVIPSYRVGSIRGDLETCGIDDITIFPDLEGLSRTLEEKWKVDETNYPHEGVFARLARSRIHGIGVFAIRRIRKGLKVFSGDIDDMVWIDKVELGRLPKEVERLYDDFAVLKSKRYGCPVNFNRLTPSWYLNHSKSPNVRCDENYDFVALRDIKPGEELTADYSTYSE